MHQIIKTIEWIPEVQNLRPKNIKISPERMVYYQDFLKNYDEIITLDNFHYLTQVSYEVPFTLSDITAGDNGSDVSQDDTGGDVGESEVKMENKIES